MVIVACPSARTVALVQPVRLARPIRFCSVRMDWTVSEAVRLAHYGAAGADYWRVEVYVQGSVWWRNEPNESCARSMLRILGTFERPHLRRGYWHSLRRVPLLWWRESSLEAQ